MSKVIALAIGMTGTFFAAETGGAGQRAEITRIWSETCVNIKITSGAGFGAPDPTSVFVPPLDTPAERHPAGYYFLPDAFVAAALAEPTNERPIVQADADKAPRVTPFDIEAQIRSEFYFTASDGVLGESEMGTRPAAWTNLDQVTICVLILRNGTKIVGVNEGPVSRENFSADIGRKYARQKAVDQIWPMLGYELRTKLENAVDPRAAAVAESYGNVTHGG